MSYIRTTCGRQLAQSLALGRPAALTHKRRVHCVYYSASRSSFLPLLCDGMQRFQRVSDDRLLGLQQPINHVLGIVMAALDILREVEAVDVGHVEGLVLRVVVVHVRATVSL